MLSSRDLGRSINLLTPDNLAELLGWVPSHIRKFAENARHHKLDGWNESFGKEASYDALAALLALPNGLDTAEAICRRAKIKCIREVAESRAKRTFHGLHQGLALPPRESWPRLLAESGALIDAAWILWCDHGQNLNTTANDWVAGFKEITTLFEAPTTTQLPQPAITSTNTAGQGSETLHEIRTDILAWLDTAENDPSELASRLREAADRVEQLLLRGQQATNLGESRAALRVELERLQGEIAEISGATTAEVAKHLAELLARDEDWELNPIEQILERIPAYLNAASEWRSAYDHLSETHDYIGVKQAHEAEGICAEEILSLLASSLADQTLRREPEPGSSDYSTPPASETNLLPQSVEKSSDQIASPTATLDELAEANAQSSLSSQMAFAEATERPTINTVVDERELIGEIEGETNGATDTYEHVLRASASALGERRYGLAALIAQVAETNERTAPFGFSSGLLHALSAGLIVGTLGGSRAVNRFASARSSVEALLSSDTHASIRLMALAAGLRPALFAISLGADQLLRQLSSLQSLVPAAHGLALFAANNVRNGDIVPAELASLGNQMAPRVQYDALRQDTERFLAIAHRRTIKFQPATAIWINVLRNSPVSDALHAIVEEARNAEKLVEIALNSTLSDIDRLITDRDKEALGGKKREPLTAQPRATLHGWLGDVAERLKTWLKLHEAIQNEPHDRYKAVNREELKTRLEAASTELRLLDSHGNPALKFAADAAHEAIDSVLTLFTETSISLPVSTEEELFFFGRPMMIDDAKHWTSQEKNQFFQAAEYIATQPPDFDAAFRDAIQRGRFTLADRIRERIVASDPLRDEALDRTIRGEWDRKLNAAKSALTKTRSRLNDLLGADDRQILSRDLSPGLDELEFQIAQSTGPIDLAEWSTSLQAIEGQLERGFDSLLGPLLIEVDNLERTGQDVSELRKMVELRDLATLSEHIEAYKHGATQPTAATDLLVAFNAYIQGQNKLTDLPSLERAIEIRASLDGVNFSRWEDGEIDTARALLKAWRDLKENDGNQSPPQLRALFQALFAATAIEVTINKNPEVPGHYQLRTTPGFSTRADCVVPAFGSEAKGRYEIVLVDRRGIGSGVELATLKGKLSAPTFFIVRGPMPGAARKSFMQSVRAAGAAPGCGLIDEATILFLAMRRGWQRSDIFGLSLACGVVQPYSDAAQKTSPEMFFGRHEELRELWDPNGSCLVYGGRQLGKTALLRQIVLRHSKPNQFVVYGDDEVEEFTRQGRQGFWRWIGKRAEENGVPIPGKRGEAEVQQAIRNWLEPDATRRLLFLIDEADKFLSSELRSGFKMLLQLRELMRVTDRRCKFIFAGLHDVQRLARTPNSPLLHFGTPIRVGPLMGKDLFEARNMVEQPMAAAGYAFGTSIEEGRALMGRALSEVGYYPSLMQTFGMVLVNRMNARAASNIVGDPPELPIRISDSQLNAALEDSAFRNNVRDKFDKTLDLDPRYRLIAYLVLINTQKVGIREEMRPGMSIADIQKEAMFWWPQGFVEDSSNSAFEGLLKEMEGLGVLVALNDGRYAIRSARIAAMLGSVTEVEDRLQELAEQRYDVVEDTGSLRRAIGKAPSPLTFRQEAILLESRNMPTVTLVLTSNGLGLQILPAAIEELTKTDEDTLVIHFPSIDTVPKLERAIATVASRAREAGRQKGLLIASGPWLGKEVIEAAQEHPEVRRSQRLSNQGKEQGVRVILLPSMIDWRELANEDLDDRLWGAALVSLSPLHDASLHEWLERRTGSRSVPSGAIEKLRLMTGGFPEILEAIPGDSAEQIMAAAEGAHAAMLSAPEKVLPQIGLGDIWLRQVIEFVLNECDGAVSAGDQDAIVELMSGVGLRDADRALNILGKLGLLDRTTDTPALPGWQLNPFAAQLLHAMASN